jgi:hypothetical protein
VQDDLDRRVGEHRRQRRGVEAVHERVEHGDLLADDDLDEAEERLVPPLRHELRVEAEPAELARRLREPVDLRLRQLHLGPTLPGPPGRVCVSFR